MSFFSKTGIYFSDSTQLDAFGRIRSTSPVTMFECKQIVDNAPLIFDDAQISGSGTTSTYNANQASTTIAVSNTTAGARVRQSKARTNYQPGKSQQCMITFLMGAGAVGITKRVGLFDENNGIFLERLDNAVNLVLRTNTSGSPSDTASVAQASWNIDPMNGSGPSGITLDLTKVNLLTIDYSWLGVSRVRVGFVINGIEYTVHQFTTANIGSLVYMGNPNLPIRYEIRNGGTGPAASLATICSMVASEGGSPNVGIRRASDRGITSLVTLANTNIFPVIVVRLGSAFLSSTIWEFIGNLICTTNVGVYRWTIVLNPTIVGTALSFSAVANSSAEVAIPTNGTTVTGGTVLNSGYEVGSSSSKIALQSHIADFQIGATIAGVSDILVLAIQVPGGTAETFYGGISWQEAR